MRKQGRRVLCFPFPLQGHVTPMLNLAALLLAEGFSITIIHTRYNCIDPSHFPRFTFHLIEDGCSEKPATFSLLSDLNAACSDPFRDFLSRTLSRDQADPREPVACLITDCLWRFASAVAGSFNLPRIVLRTASVSAVIAFDSLTLLRQKGYFSPQENNLEEQVVELPPLRVKDLPPEVMHDALEASAQDTRASQGIIFNTFEELEDDALANLRREIPIPLFTVGPLHKHSQLALTGTGTQLAQDRSSLSWLDAQAPKLVLYVSFGSLAGVSQAEFREMAWGLARSEWPFLWVARPGFVQGSEGADIPFPEGYLDAVSGRGKIVNRAPQAEVLAHPAVGGFWTHCGWNSTLESVCEGVPMICTPLFADQPVNARHVSDSWRAGLWLEKGSERDEIEGAIRKLMVGDEGEDVRNGTTKLKKKAELCVMEGGSSRESLQRLTAYICSL